MQLEGNGWKHLDITGYQVTENTMLRFDFAGNGMGEIQGIGFDNDNTIDNLNDSEHFFQVDGSQNWSLKDLDQYILGSADGFTQYDIPVGNFLTGEFDFLTIANDHDVANPTAVAQFQNIELNG